MHNLLKYLPLLAIIIFSGNAMGVRSNGFSTVDYDGNQKVDDDEFLYLTADDHDAALTSVSDGNKNSGNGIGAECDSHGKTRAFTNGQTVDMPANHYWNGRLVPNATTYRCSTERRIGLAVVEVDDRWVPETNNFCRSQRHGDIFVDGCVKDNNGECRVFTNGKVDCSGLPMSDNNGKTFEIRCVTGPTLQCVAVSCDFGLVAKDGKCVKNDNSQSNTDYCAIDSIKEGAAVIGDCFKLWNGANGLQNTCVSFTKDKCKQNKITVSDEHGKNFIANCLQNKTFECIPTSCENGYELKDGKCAKIGGNSPVKKNPTFKCPDDTEQLLNDWEREYGTNKGIMDLIKQIRELCQSKKPEEAGYNKLIVQIKVLIEQIKSEAKITELTRGLSDMQAKFTTSHWTDKEGNFNKKRLLSDSIAATVLGTTGGLITSHVMKKKQAENGFDALQCTVGGQSVATWGDEFTVGIQ